MSERIYIGRDEDLAAVMRDLLALSPEDPRAIVWVPEEYAVDVPEEVAARYIKPEAKKAPRVAKAAKKAAKAVPPPASTPPVESSSAPVVDEAPAPPENEE